MKTQQAGPKKSQRGKFHERMACEGHLRKHIILTTSQIRSQASTWLPLRQSQIEELSRARNPHRTSRSIATTTRPNLWRRSGLSSREGCRRWGTLGGTISMADSVAGTGESHPPPPPGPPNQKEPTGNNRPSRALRDEDPFLDKPNAPLTLHRLFFQLRRGDMTIWPCP